jgi:ABC-type histidine transport system ATPase subunit
MHQGRVWEKGSPARLFGTPETAELASFIDAILPVDPAATRRTG